MKHHCHCGLGDKLHQLKAGKLGLLGGIFLVLHLLFHVAECMVLPALIVAFRGETVATSELSEQEATEYSALPQPHRSVLYVEFRTSLEIYSPLRGNSILAENQQD